jgi:hypothetical protein
VSVRGTSRGRTAIVAVVAIIVGLGGCASAPEPPTVTPFPSLTPVALVGGAVGVKRALLTEPLVPRTGDRPDGPELVTDPDGLPEALAPRTEVVLLGNPQPGPDGTWVRVWIQEDPQVSAGDFYAWLPATMGGRETMKTIDPVTCPTEATVDTLAPLVQQDRLRCVGSTAVTIDVRSGQLGRVPLYDVEPAWYGRNAGPPTTALFNPGPARFGPDAKTAPEAAGAWLVPRIPPDVAPIPLGFYLRVTGHFDDPSAAGCRRAAAFGVPGRGVPLEAAADSVQWCREQFVVSSWQALLGPEGRPIDPRDPQLHRREFRLPPGAVFACGGVGMPPLTMRIDASEVDPVWIDLPGGRRSMPVFGPEFRIRLDPPRIESTTGVTLLDREVVDPDRGKPGLWLCPSGEVVTFDIAQ